MLSFLITLQNHLNARLADDEGQGMVEYALIVGGISLVLVTAFMVMGVSDAVTGLSTAVAGAITG